MQQTNPSQDPQILIVEDDVNSAFILQTILVKAGYKVFPIATNGETAIERVQTSHPSLLLVDITLQGQIDGIETVHRLKKNYDIPVIYLTGHTSDDIIRRVKDTTPFGFILKPYSPKSVLITTEMALHKSAIERDSKDTKYRLSITLGSLKDAIITTDPSGIITYLNPSAEKHLQLESTHVLGLNIDDFLQLYEPTQPPVKVKTFKQFLSLDARCNLEPCYFLSLSPSNEKRWVQVQVIPTLDQQGGVTSYVTVIIDLSKQFHFEQNNRMLATALESLEDGVLVAEAENENTLKIVYVNKGFKRITLYHAHELLGKPIECLYGQDFDLSLKSSLAVLSKTGETVNGDTPLLRKDGKKIMTNWTVSPFYKEDRQIFHLVIIIRDVTELRQMEENLRQSQKIEAIGRLAGGIAHDFNNLLSVINGYSDLLKAKMEPTSTYYPYVLNIHEAGQRGAELVNQLMVFSRQENKAGKEVLDLREVASNTLKMLSHWLGKNIQLKTYFEDGLWSVQSKPTYIDQILVNLCVNARDAMPDGGVLSVHLNNFQNNDGKEKIDIPLGRYVVISVRDTGTGITENVQKKMFEPFFTTKPIGKGTGLGLSTVYGIVQQHGGCIKVNSKVDEGSTFHVYLPAQEWIKKEETLNQSSQVHNVVQAKSRNQTKTILIFHEDKGLSDCLKGLLSLNGYNVSLTQSPEETIELLNNKPVELLITDTKNLTPRFETIFNQVPAMSILLTSQENSLHPDPNVRTKYQTIRQPFSLNGILKEVQKILKT